MPAVRKKINKYSKNTSLSLTVKPV